MEVSFYHPRCACCAHDCYCRILHMPNQCISLSHPFGSSFHGTLGPRTFTSSLGHSGICHLAQAVKVNVDELLNGVGDKNAIEEVKHILVKARRASSRREVLHYDFLTPPVLKESMIALEKLADVKAVAQGGYPQAERCQFSVGHPEALISDPDIIATLRESYNG